MRAQRLRLLMAAAVQEAQKQLDALETLSSKNLKQVLAEHSVGFEGVVEKEELVEKTVKLSGLDWEHQCIFSTQSEIGLFPAGEHSL